jgi:hypothetical protein
MSDGIYEVMGPKPDVSKEETQWCRACHEQRVHTPEEWKNHPAAGSGSADPRHQ